MNSSEFVAKLKHIASDLPTTYRNTYPKNLGYWDGSKYSFDCWNLIKAILNGWTDGGKVGSYQKYLSKTGDIDGATILSKCSGQSKDFSKLTVAGTYLYMSSPKHAGIYIGETVIDGQTYNVVECTASWDAKVIYSWVDADGTRRRYKGGNKSRVWTNFGLLPWVDYEGATTPSAEQPTTYGIEDFRKEVMQALNVASMQAAFNNAVTVSATTNRRYCLVKPLERYFKSLGYYNGAIDGIFGNGMKAATIKYQKEVVGNPVKWQDGVLSYGGQTWRKLLLG